VFVIQHIFEARFPHAESPRKYAPILRFKIRLFQLVYLCSFTTENIMKCQDEARTAFAKSLGKMRLERGLTQAAVAAAAGLSEGYLSQIESANCVPPPRSTLLRILSALGIDDPYADELAILAAEARGLSSNDSDLPDHVQALIMEIRKHSADLDARCIQGMRARIRAAISQRLSE
jgi:transcriptional regulator with XRE-family HTH domain